MKIKIINKPAWWFGYEVGEEYEVEEKENIYVFTDLNNCVHGFRKEDCEIIN